MSEIEEKDNTQEDKKEMKMGKAGLYTKFRYDKDQDLYNSLVDGSKPSIRNLNQAHLKREDKLKIAREFVWSNGLLYRIIQIKLNYITSGFSISHENDDVLEFYQDINEELDMDTYIKNAAFEHEVIGEWCPYLNWNGSDLRNLTILNPINVRVRSVFGKDLISIKPTDELKDLLRESDKDIQRRLKKVIPNKFYDKWKSGKEVLLNDEESLRYVNTKAYHEKHAHSPIEPIFDDLALLSVYKESDYSIAYKIKKAILQVKVGNEKFNPKEPLDMEIIDQAEEMFTNPSESMEIFTQWFMDADWVIPDKAVYHPEKYEPVITQIMNWAGLNVILSDQSTYGSGVIKAQAFYNDVQETRKTIKKSIRDIYRRIAKRKGKTTYGGKLKLPEIKFSNDVFLDNEELLNTVQFLYKHGLISPDTTLDRFGFDFGEELKIKEGKKQTYIDNVYVPFEPSQDISLRSFERMRYQHQLDRDDMVFEKELNDSIPSDDEDLLGNNGEEV